MTEITPDQHRMETAARSVAAKLRAFHDGLPADEQVALHFLLGHGAAAAAGTDQDVAGYAFGIFASDGPINPYRDWCGTCRTPWNPSQLPR